MKKLIVVFCTWIALGLTGAASAEGQEVRLQRTVVGSGGGSMAGDARILRATLGQPVAGRTMGAASILGAGFWYRPGTAPSGVALEDGGELPARFDLKQNYPNPFNPRTVIGFDLPRRSHVTLVVFDILGRQVRRLVDGPMPAGRHEVAFEAADLGSGVYLYRLHAGDFVQTRTLTVLR